MEKYGGGIGKKKVGPAVGSPTKRPARNEQSYFSPCNQASPAAPTAEKRVPTPQKVS
jgi:hypothetical protein